jgi:acyl-CoA dehydrogenase
MNFDDTPEEAAFRKQVREWLAANAPAHLAQHLNEASFGRAVLKSADMMQAAKAWQKRKFDAGWACLHWPKEYGGRAATAIERIIWEQEEGVYSILSGIFILGHGMCGPTLIAYASEAQKQRFLPPMAAGEEIWCQLFSEPAGGSDLAGLRTRAERAGDHWILNGQKIWTSGAHYSDYGLCITRSDATVPKHQGLTMFFVDMKSPGIEVRPIKQANGMADFNEVYFTDVRVPDSQRLAVAGVMPTGFPEMLELCSQLETSRGRAIDDPAVRARLASWAVRTSGLKYTGLRSISALSKGRAPGPENSIGKLVVGQMLQEIATYALDLQGQLGALLKPEQAAFEAYFQDMLLRSPAIRIEGGTDEILRNIIAERVLGLPPDIRVDKSVPFNQIPTRARQ